MIPIVYTTHLILFSTARNVLTLPSSWALAFNTFSAAAPIMAWQYVFEGDRYGLVYGFLAMQVGGMAGSIIAVKINSYSMFLCVAIANSVAVYLFGLHKSNIYLPYIMFAAHIILHVCQSVYISTIFHESISDDNRATSTSIVSATDSILSIPAFLYVGYLLDSGYFVQGMAVSSFIIILVIIFSSFHRARYD